MLFVLTSGFVTALLRIIVSMGTQDKKWLTCRSLATGEYPHHEEGCGGETAGLIEKNHPTTHFSTTFESTQNVFPIQNHHFHEFAGHNVPLIALL